MYSKIYLNFNSFNFFYSINFCYNNNNNNKEPEELKRNNSFYNINKPEGRNTC